MVVPYTITLARKIGISRGNVVRSKKIRLRLAFTVIAAIGHQNLAMANGSPVSSDIERLAAQCAPSVDHKTLAYIVAHESSNRQYAINVNYGSPQLSRQPTNHVEALEAIGSLESEGHNFDLGIAQINSANFEGLGVSAEDLLDPCNNIGKGAVVLEDCYQRALRRNSDEQQALRMALSCYNTGSFQRGFDNGYVSRIERIAEQDQVVPRLLVGQSEPPPSQAEATIIRRPIQEQTVSNDTESFIMSDAFSSGSSGAFAEAPPGAFN